MATAAIAMCITYFFSDYEIRIGKQENSPAIRADGKHIRTDIVVSFIVLLGLVGKLTHAPAEKVATVIVDAHVKSP